MTRWPDPVAPFSQRWWLIEDTPYAHVGVFVYTLLLKQPIATPLGWVQADAREVIWGSGVGAVRLHKGVFMRAWNNWHGFQRFTQRESIMPRGIPQVARAFEALWAGLPAWTKSVNPFSSLIEEHFGIEPLRIGRRWSNVVDQRSVDWTEVKGLLAVRCFHCRNVWQIAEGPVVGIVAIYADKNHWFPGVVSADELHFELASRYERPTCSKCSHPVGLQDGDRLWIKALLNLNDGRDEVYS